MWDHSEVLENKMKVLDSLRRSRCVGELVFQHVILYGPAGAGIRVAHRIVFRGRGSGDGGDVLGYVSDTYKPTDSAEVETLNWAVQVLRAILLGLLHVWE